MRRRGGGRGPRLRCRISGESDAAPGRPRRPARPGRADGLRQPRPAAGDPADRPGARRRRPDLLRPVRLPAVRAIRRRAPRPPAGRPADVRDPPPPADRPRLPGRRLCHLVALVSDVARGPARDRVDPVGPDPRRLDAPARDRLLRPPPGHRRDPRPVRIRRPDPDAAGSRDGVDRDHGDRDDPVRSTDRRHPGSGAVDVRVVPLGLRPGHGRRGARAARQVRQAAAGARPRSRVRADRRVVGAQPTGVLRPASRCWRRGRHRVRRQPADRRAAIRAGVRGRGRAVLLGLPLARGDHRCRRSAESDVGRRAPRRGHHDCGGGRCLSRD